MSEKEGKYCKSVEKKHRELYNMVMEFISESEQQTIELANEFAKTLKGGEVILLNGELGAGKTTFSKGLAKGLGIEETITSPTFTLLNIYESGRLKLYHFDMYRLAEESDLDYGFDEYYGEKGSVCLIEWSKGKYYNRARVVVINIDYLSEDKRRINIYEASLN